MPENLNAGITTSFDVTEQFTMATLIFNPDRDLCVLKSWKKAEKTNFIACVGLACAFEGGLRGYKDV